MMMAGLMLAPTVAHTGWGARVVRSCHAQNGRTQAGSRWLTDAATARRTP